MRRQVPQIQLLLEGSRYLPAIASGVKIMDRRSDRNRSIEDRVLAGHRIHRVFGGSLTGPSCWGAAGWCRFRDDTDCPRQARPRRAPEVHSQKRFRAIRYMHAGRGRRERATRSSATIRSRSRIATRGPGVERLASKADVFACRRSPAVAAGGGVVPVKPVRIGWLGARLQCDRGGVACQSPRWATTAGPRRHLPAEDHGQPRCQRGGYMAGVSSYRVRRRGRPCRAERCPVTGSRLARGSVRNA